MIKWTILAKAKAGLHEQRFNYHWRMIHAPLVLRMSRMRRYVQNHCIEPSAWQLPAAGINGVVECWFDDLDSALETLSGPEYLEYAHLDEPNLGNPDGSSVFFMREQVVKTASDSALDGMVKVMLFLDGAGAGQLRQDEGEAVIDVLRVFEDDFAAIEFSVPLPEHQHGRTYQAMISLWMPGPKALAGEDGAGSRLCTALSGLFDLSRSTSFLAEPYVLRGEGVLEPSQARKHIPA